MALDPDRVEKELTDVMNEVWVEDSPFIADFVEGKVPKENLARFAPSYCYQVEQFKRCVAAVYVQAEPHDVRALMLANLEEEHGEGDPSRDHTALVAKFARALGATIEDIYAVEPIPESREWIDRILRVCRDEDFVVGLAAISFGIEFRTQTMALLGQIYRDQYGLSEDDLEFFFMHLEADEEHAGRAIELVRKYCTTEEQLDRCKGGVREVLEATKRVAEGVERVCS